MNEPGRTGPTFHVVPDCICCSVCTGIAPAHFRLDDIAAVVIRQPETAAEVALCRDALEGCPVESIVER